MPQAPLEDTPVSQGSKKKNIVVVAITSFVVLTIAVVFFLLANNPVNAFKQALERNDIATAAVLYNEKLTGKDKAIIQPIVSELVTQVINEYANNTLEFDVANEKLQQLVVLIRLGNVEIFEAQETIQRIENSRTAYIQGMDEIANENYESAIQLLSTVIDLDTNYSQAQQAIEQAKSQYIVVSLKEADSLATEELYSEAKAVIDTALLVFPTDEALLQEQQMYVDLIDEQQHEIARKKEEAEVQRREKEAEEWRKWEIEEQKENERNEVEQAANREKNQFMIARPIIQGERLQTFIACKQPEKIHYSFAADVTFLFYDSTGQPLPGDEHMKKYAVDGNAKDKEYLRIGMLLDVLRLEDFSRAHVKKGTQAIACVSLVKYTLADSEDSLGRMQEEIWTNSYYSDWLELYRDKPMP